MKLYFGNAVTTATTLMILALLGFIGWSAFNRTNIQYSFTGAMRKTEADDLLLPA